MGSAPPKPHIWKEHGFWWCWPSRAPYGVLGPLGGYTPQAAYASWKLHNAPHSN